VEIAFDDAKLQRICEDETRMVRKFGPDRTKRLKLRLSAMDAADSLEDLRHAPGRYHELRSDWTGHLSADLDHPYRLIFRPTADPAPVDEHGGLQWDDVRSVTIVAIVDTH